MAISGIANVAVEPREGTPVVRVWLDGTRQADEVAEDVTALLGASGPGEGADGDRPSRTGRRGGLGRGLDALLAAPERRSSVGGVLETLSVLEDADGVRVRAITSDGRSSETEIRDGDEHGAVAGVVAAVAGFAAPRSLAVDLHRVGDVPVVTVVLELDDGDRVAGAALTHDGSPYDVGCAVWAALRSAGGAPV